MFKRELGPEGRMGVGRRDMEERERAGEKGPPGEGEIEIGHHLFKKKTYENAFWKHFDF